MPGFADDKYDVPQSTEPVNLRHLWRFAKKYAAARVEKEQEYTVPLLYNDRLTELRKQTILLNHSINRAIRSGSQGCIPSSIMEAFDREAARVLDNLRDAQRVANRVRYGIPRPKGTKRSEMERNVFCDLVHLEKTDPSFQINLKEGWVSVTTNNIDLYCDQTDEEIELGSFQLKIVAEPTEGGNDAPRAIALEPNPSNGEGYPHPHVDTEGHICLGEGDAAVRNAMSSGRIGDALDICDSIINTYNGDNPFCELQHWTSFRCPECGDSVDEDDICHCNKCGKESCGGCQSTCGDCMESVCSEHRKRCSGCREYFCPSCVNECQDCGLEFCTTDFDSAFDRCKECQREREEEEKTEAAKAAAEAALAEQDNMPTQTTFLTGYEILGADHSATSYTRVRDALGRFAPSRRT